MTNRENYAVLDDGPSVEEAVERDLPYVLKVVTGYLTFDFDGQGAVSRSEKLHLELLLNGYRPCTFNSGRVAQDGNPHRHLFVYIEDEQEREVWAQRARAYAVHARTDIRAPWAAHRDGHRSVAVLPNDPYEVRSRLCGRGRPYGQFAPEVHENIYGIWAERKNRSEALFLVSLELQRRRWSYQEAMLLFGNENYTVGRSLAGALRDRRRDESWFRDYVWGAAERKYPRPSPRTVRRLRYLRHREILTREADRGTRLADLAILELLLQAAEAFGRWEVSMAYLDIQEYANIGSPKTVSAALSRLKTAGIVEQLVGNAMLAAEEEHGNPNREMKASWYRLVVPQNFGIATEEQPPCAYLLSDAFRNRTGLNKSAGLVYELMLIRGGSGTAAELARASCLSMSSVRRGLTAMVGAGLVEQVSSRYHVTALHPDEVELPSASESIIRARRRGALAREGYAQRARRPQRAGTTRSQRSSAMTR